MRSSVDRFMIVVDIGVLDNTHVMRAHTDRRGNLYGLANTPAKSSTTDLPYYERKGKVKVGRTNMSFTSPCS